MPKEELGKRDTSRENEVEVFTRFWRRPTERHARTVWVCYM